MFKSHDFQKNLLKWYDKHRRDLPWRAHSGCKADPYHVWLSEIMLQQTTVPHAIPYFLKFLKLWPTLKKFAAAENEAVMREWAGLGYYARARNLHKCAQVLVRDHKSIFPDTEQELQALPGIGPYTSAAITAIAFDRPAVVIDGNVDRIITRVFGIETPMRESKPLIRQKAEVIYQDIKRPGDFAQGLMDLGATVCVPQTPRCGVCPVTDFCKAYKKGLQNALPAKPVKKLKPQRVGKAYWLETSDGEILLERRPDKRMLGGMVGLPSSGWDGKAESILPKRSEKGLEYVGDIYHSFTHFDLKLEIWRGALNKMDVRNNSIVFKKADLISAGLPSVFKKIAKVMLANEK